MSNLRYYLEIAFNNAKYSVPYNSNNITKEILLDFLSERRSTTNGGLGLTASSWTRFIRKVFVDKITTENYISFLLNKLNMKLCPTCSTVKTYNQFYLNKTRKNNIASTCKECEVIIQRDKQKIYMSSRRAHILKAFPKWADKEKIKIIYKNCPIGYHVDHIIPLKNNIVCGLHCEFNLQYLLAEDNYKKNNQYIVS